jgi:hypothetical protein
VFGKGLVKDKDEVIGIEEVVGVGITTRIGEFESI